MKIGFTDKNLQVEFQKFYPNADYIVLSAEELLQPLTADFYVMDSKSVTEIAGTYEQFPRPSIFVAVNEKEPVPAVFQQGFADDILVLPLRGLDVFRTLRMHENLAALREVELSSRGIPQLVKKLQEDILLAQKIQRRLIKDKFPPMGGLTIKSKYWCGMKSGGDYFDIFEFPDGNYVGIIMSDSSSYSLSTHLLGALMQFSMHSAEEKTNPSIIVRTLLGKIRDEMKEKDQLSLFYGVLDRKTYQMKYVDCGGVFAYWQTGEEKKWIAEGKNSALTKANALVPEVQEIAIEPGDRLVLLSDGWKDGLENGWKDLPEKQVEASDYLNEVSFRLRKSIERNMNPEEITEEFPMPPQDCSVMVIDVAKNLLRLAK